MDQNRVLDVLRSRFGSPQPATLGQIMATVWAYGGCLIEHEDATGRVVKVWLGRRVERTPDTVILVNYKTY